MVAGILSAAGLAQTVAVHGHRGARAMRPENTLPAFEYAIAEGVDALELDMAVTRDNVIVVSHDPQLRAPICTGPRDRAVIHELTLAEVRGDGDVLQAGAVFVADLGVERGRELFTDQHPSSISSPEVCLSTDYADATD